MLLLGLLQVELVLYVVDDGFDAVVYLEFYLLGEVL